MSNGILPVQSVRGTLREWIMNNAFPHTNLGAEFFNRLMNLCNYDYPMSSALQGAVTTKFGLGLVYIINQYTTLTSPKLNTANRLAIRRVVPDEFYLEFIRLFDCDCCPAIIGEYSDRSLFPTGTTVGEIAVERYSTDLGGGDVEYIVNFYSWTGVFWNSGVFLGSILSSGETSLVTISTSANYEASVDLGATWETSDHNFGSPVTGFPVWFRNTVNGCVYTSLPVVPFTIEYCVSYGEIDASDFLFNFGTINGADASDPAAVLATYTDWEGNTNTVTRVGTGDTSFYINMFYPSDSIPPVNFGLYSNDFTDPPVSNQVIPVSFKNCAPTCYVGVFTVNDLSTDSLTGLVINGSNIDYTNDYPLIDPDAAAAVYLATLISDHVLEPSATIAIALNGLEVTMTICTVNVLTQGAWSDGAVEQGTFPFTA